MDGRAREESAGGVRDRAGRDRWGRLIAGWDNRERDGDVTGGGGVGRR